MISVVCGRTVTTAEIFTLAFQFLLKMNRYWTWSQAPSPAPTHPRHTEQCHPSLWQHRAPPGSEVRGSMLPGSKNSSWMIWTVTLTGTERALRKSCKRTPYVGNLSCRSLHTSAFSHLLTSSGAGLEAHYGHPLHGHAPPWQQGRRMERQN